LESILAAVEVYLKADIYKATLQYVKMSSIMNSVIFLQAYLKWVNSNVPKDIAYKFMETLLIRAKKVEKSKYLSTDECIN
jgi:hypothetical protein